MSAPRLLLAIAGSVVAVHVLVASLASGRVLLVAVGVGGLAAWWWAVRRLRPRALGVLAVAIGVGSVVIGAGVSLAELAHGRRATEDVTGIAALGAGLVLVVAGAVLLLRGRRWWAWIAAGAVAVVALYWVVLPVTVATMATRSGHGPSSERTPAVVGLRASDEVLRTSDGTAVAAWWIPGRNGAAVIVRHGASAERSSALDHAKVLADAGFSVLVMDARGHGDSDGTAMRFGWEGVADIEAGVDFVLAQPEVDGRIGVLGLSMGGEEALTAAAADERIGAVVAEGATMRTVEDFLQIDRGLAMWLSVPHYWVMYTAADLLSPSSPPPPLRDAIAAIAPRPVLLITAGDVPDERTFAVRYRDAAPGSTEVWAVEGASHTGGLETDPVGWRSRVIGLFEEALVAPSR